MKVRQKNIVWKLATELVLSNAIQFGLIGLNERIRKQMASEVCVKSYKVKMLCDDQRHNDWKEGEIGYIDGYSDLYAAIVLGTSNMRLIFARANQFEILSYE